jgi:hypothetical protein
MSLAKTPCTPAVELDKQKASILPCFTVATTSLELHHLPRCGMDSAVSFGCCWCIDCFPRDPN